MYIVSFVIGLIIVISSIFLIRFEFNKAIRNQALLLEQSKLYKNSDLFDMLENLQISIDEMNRAFYDIASDLEGKYSVHEKEIELVNQMLDSLKKQMITNNLGSTPATHYSNDVKVNMEHMNKRAESNAQISKVQVKQEQQEKKSNIEMSHKKVDHQSNSEQELIDQIIELRSKGNSLAQIARELGIGMGEIQLLLSLKK